MKKKTGILIIMGFFIVSGVSAEIPKVGIEMCQHLAAGWSDKQMSATAYDRGNDSLYSRTEIKASVPFTFGNFTITPWIRERLEMKLNTGGSSNASLFDQRWRNRLFLGWDNTWKIIDPLSVLFNFEFMITSDLRSSWIGEGYLVSQMRFSPLLGLAGNIGGLSYKLTEYFHIYAKDYKPALADAEKIRTEWEGLYNVSYILKFEKISIIFNLCDNLGFEMGIAGEGDERMYNILSAQVSLKIGDIAPYAGFTSDLCYDMDAGSMNDNIIGLKTGICLTKEKVTFGIDYRIGKELESETIQSYATTNLKIKF